MNKMLDETNKKVEKLRLDQYYGITAHHFGEQNDQGLTKVAGGSFISSKVVDKRKAILQEAHGTENPDESKKFHCSYSQSLA
jgi:hypothetical protein